MNSLQEEDYKVVEPEERSMFSFRGREISNMARVVICFVLLAFAVLVGFGFKAWRHHSATDKQAKASPATTIKPIPAPTPFAQKLVAAENTDSLCHSQYPVTNKDWKGLSGVAWNCYRNASTANWKEIARVNGIEGPNYVIKQGATLVIPAISAVAMARSKRPTNSNESATATHATTTHPSSVSRAKTHDAVKDALNTARNAGRDFTTLPTISGDNINQSDLDAMRQKYGGSNGGPSFVPPQQETNQSSPTTTSPTTSPSPPDPTVSASPPIQKPFVDPLVRMGVCDDILQSFIHNEAEKNPNTWKRFAPISRATFCAAKGLPDDQCEKVQIADEVMSSEVGRKKASYELFREMSSNGDISKERIRAVCELVEVPEVK